MAELILGPLLRHVGTNDATIWVETDAACEVEVRTGSARASGGTFAVAGHHYAIVVLDGLRPGACEAYTVHLDGAPVWPLADREYPPSRLRTIDPSRPLQVLFGSCRAASEVVVRDPTRAGEDVLEGYARRMATRPPETWPMGLFMLGDQVYADEPSEPVGKWLAARRDTTKTTHNQAAKFHAHTNLDER